MSVEKVDTLVVGAGQAGVAMSEHLSKCGVPHLVLERGRIAERWRSERWDSLVANGPAWHDRFPGMEFPGAHPDAFVAKEKVADYFVDYAGMIKAPIRCGVEVKEVRRNVGRPGFRVETSEGVIEANNVVAATGPLLIVLVYSFLTSAAYGGVEWKFSPEAWISVFLERDIFDDTLSLADANVTIFWRSIKLALMTRW